MSRKQSEQSYARPVSWSKASLWQDKRPQLSQLDIELTERCNFKCIHCYINQPAADKGIKAREMSTAQVKSILDQAAELGALEVRFTGGEPLLRDDFEELYLHSRRLGLKVVLFTNGSLITPALADLFARVPLLGMIEITVYGTTASSYQAVTGLPGAHGAVQRGIHLLLDRGVPFMIKGSLLPPSEEEREAFEAWAITLPQVERAPSYSMFFDLRGRRDSPEKNRQIRALRPSPEAGLAALTRDEEAYASGRSKFCSQFLESQGDELFACGAGTAGCVDAYGKLQPCMLLRHPETVYDLLGDSHQTSLRHALTEFFPRLRQRRAQNSDYLDRCARCSLKGLCGQCPAKSWMEHGTLDTPVEYLCRVAHVQARYLGLLDEGENAWEVEDWPERLARISPRA